jgi:molecular chaperone GrpE
VAKKHSTITHENQLATLEARVAELEGLWKRALADYQNLQKRNLEQQTTMAQLASLSLIERLLPVYDHLVLAAHHLNDSGLDMVVNQFNEALEAEGVTMIEALNQEYDAATMECVEQVPGSKNQVISIINQGFAMGSRVIRPARVTVGNGEPIVN